MKGAMHGIAAADRQYTMACDRLYEFLMDLSIPRANVQHEVSQILTQRERLIQMHNAAGNGQFAPPQQAYVPQRNGQQKFMQALPAPAAAPTLPREGVGFEFKNMLHAAMSKRVGRNLTAKEVPYTSELMPNGQWHAEVTGEGLMKPYAGYAVEKKLAEQAAARAALQKEFREILEGKLGSIGKGGGKMLGMQNGAAGQKGQHGAAAQKAPAVAAQPQEQDAKCKLTIYLQALLNEPLTKGAIAYSSEETVDEMGNVAWVGKVTFPTTEYFEENCFEGELAPSKKEAEHSAAAWAVKAIEDIAKPIYEDNKAVKRAADMEKKADQKRRKLEETVA